MRIDRTNPNLGHLLLFPILATLLAVVNVDARASTRRVPSAYATIRQAIDACSTGDSVLVAPGTYSGTENRNLRFWGTDIVLISEAGSEVTTIDCGMQGAGILLLDGESAQSRIEGFTIRNASEGGIFCAASDPTIVDCRIVSNRPGGIILNDASPTISRCTIAGNRSSGSGGGIYCYTRSAPFIVESLITGNRADGGGGGIYCSTSTLTVVLCTIVNNHASHGGGIFCQTTSSIVLERSILWENCAEVGNDGFAGFSSSLSFECCVVDEERLLGSVEILGRQIASDPLFCEPRGCLDTPGDDGDYTLALSSPCTAENSPCGERVGALDAVCDLEPTILVSWGALKASYRAD